MDKNDRVEITSLTPGGQIPFIEGIAILETDLDKSCGLGEKWEVRFIGDDGNPEKETYERWITPYMIALDSDKAPRDKFLDDDDETVTLRPGKHIMQGLSSVKSTKVPTTETYISIKDYVIAHEGAELTVPIVRDALNLKQQQTHRIMQQLVSNGVINKEGQKYYVN